MEPMPHQEPEATPTVVVQPLRPQPRPDGATLVFVMGLFGIFVCAPLGILAWIWGNDYMKRCRARRVQPEGTAVAGRIMGMIATILFVGAFFLWVVVQVAAEL